MRILRILSNIEVKTVIFISLFLIVIGGFLMLLLIYGNKHSNNSITREVEQKELLNNIQKGSDLYDKAAAIVNNGAGDADGLYENAIDIFTAVLEKEPNNIEALVKVVSSYIEINKRDEAIEYLDRYFKYHEGNIMISSWLASLYKEKGDYIMAEKYYKMSLELDPANIDAYVGIIGAYADSGEKNKALETVKKGLHMLPDNETLSDLLIILNQ